MASQLTGRKLKGGRVQRVWWCRGVCFAERVKTVQSYLCEQLLPGWPGVIVLRSAAR